jgi:hypothetical protein
MADFGARGPPCCERDCALRANLKRRISILKARWEFRVKTLLVISNTNARSIRAVAKVWHLQEAAKRHLGDVRLSLSV